MLDMCAQNTIDEWRMLYWVSAGILLLGAVLFALMASGDVQPWAQGKAAEQQVVHHIADRNKDTHEHVDT